MQPGEVPARAHGEGGRRDLRERKLEAAVAGVEQLAPRGPIGTDRLGEEAVERGVEVRVAGLEQQVAPDGEQRPGPADAGDFVEEAGEVEPVRGLSDGHQVDRVGSEPARLARRPPVANPRMRLGLGELGRRDVGRFDAAETFRELERRLPVAGRAVPGDLARRRFGGEPVV